MSEDEELEQYRIYMIPDHYMRDGDIRTSDDKHYYLSPHQYQRVVLDGWWTPQRCYRFREEMHTREELARVLGLVAFL